MTISPEMQASIRRYRQAIDNARLKIDTAVTPENREKLQVEFEKFKRQLNDSEILKLILRAEAIAPRKHRRS